MNIYDLLNECRSNLNPYLLKVLSNINIDGEWLVLDMGCGTGVSAIEIAKKFNCKIYAVDADKKALENLRENKKDYRIEILNGDLSLAKKTHIKFDLVLAEGIFNIIGFDKGIEFTDEVLKRGGYLLLHDSIGDEEYKNELLKEYGYRTLYSFPLNEEAWGKDYVNCLERNIDKYQEFKGDNVYKEIQSNIMMYKNEPKSFQSIYNLIQKL